MPLEIERENGNLILVQDGEVLNKNLEKEIKEITKRIIEDINTKSFRQYSGNLPDKNEIKNEVEEIYCTHIENANIYDFVPLFVEKEARREFKEKYNLERLV